MEMWGNLGRVMAETMLLDRILKEPDRIEIENPEAARPLCRQNGRGHHLLAAYGQLGVGDVAAHPGGREARGGLPPRR